MGSCKIYSEHPDLVFCRGYKGEPWEVVPEIIKLIRKSSNMYEFYGRMLSYYNLEEISTVENNLFDYNYDVSFRKKTIEWEDYISESGIRITVKPEKIIVLIEDPDSEKVEKHIFIGENHIGQLRKFLKKTSNYDK